MKYRILNEGGYEPILRQRFLRGLFCSHKNTTEYIKVRDISGLANLSGNGDYFATICEDCQNVFNLEDVSECSKRIKSEIDRLKGIYSKISDEKPLKLSDLPNATVPEFVVEKHEWVEKDKDDVTSESSHPIVIESLEQKNEISKGILLQSLLKTHKNDSFKIQEIHEKHFINVPYNNVNGCINKLFEMGVIRRIMRGVYKLNEPYNSYSEEDVSIDESMKKKYKYVTRREEMIKFLFKNGKSTRKEILDAFKGVGAKHVDSYLSDLVRFGTVDRKSQGVYELAKSNNNVRMGSL